MPDQQRRLLPPTTLDDMHRSVEDAFRAVGLTPPRFTPPPDRNAAAAPHRAPNHAAAPQTTPPQPNLQNEPTAAQACPQKSQKVPNSAMHSAPLTRQSAPSHANAPHKPLACKTNPTPPAPSSILHSPSSPRRLRPLTPNQLRAARLFVAGQCTNAIAAALHIDRHTLADWKRLLLFQQELRHLIDHPTQTTATPP